MNCPFFEGEPIFPSQTFDRLSDAQRWAEDTEAKLRSGGYVGDAPPDDMALSKALDRYEFEVSNKKKPNIRARKKNIHQ